MDTAQVLGSSVALCPWSKFSPSKGLFWGLWSGPPERSGPPRAHEPARPQAGLCLAAGSGVRPGLAQPTRVHTAGSARAGSHRARAGRRERQRGARTKDTTERGRPGQAVIGGRGRGQRPGRAVIGPQPLRGPPAPAPPLSAETRAAICARAGRGPGVGFPPSPRRQPSSRAGNLCTGLPPLPPPAQLRSGSPGSKQRVGPPPWGKSPMGTGALEGQRARGDRGQGPESSSVLGLAVAGGWTGRALREQGTLERAGWG